MMKSFRICVLMMGLFAAACSHFSSQEAAPVVQANQFEAHPEGDLHLVKPGETLYAIAWRYGLDYRHLAACNQIQAPYVIYVGQKLTLKAQKFVHSPKLPVAYTRVAPVPKNNPVAKSLWMWPAKGKVIKPYAATGANANKGIDIGGQLGDLIVAADAGKVVYSGAGLRGYGQLVIIKHNDTYLSAYAHNRRLLVTEDQSVTRGQPIAEMGQSDSDGVKLHFEIRKNGKPINPLDILPSTRAAEHSIK